MIKVRQKETATNLVYIYNLDTIKSLDESINDRVQGKANCPIRKYHYMFSHYDQ